MHQVAVCWHSFRCHTLALWLYPTGHIHQLSFVLEGLFTRAQRASAEEHWVPSWRLPAPQLISDGGGIPADIWLRSQRASPRRSAASWWENMPFPHERGKRGCYEGSKTKNSGEPWIKSLNFYFFPLWTWTKRYSFRFIISSHLPPRSQLSW